MHDVASLDRLARGCTRGPEFSIATESSSNGLNRLYYCEWLRPVVVRDLVCSAALDSRSHNKN
jgi:hypothetical protein